jgi:hypothetical protein
MSGMTQDGPLEKTMLMSVEPELRKRYFQLSETSQKAHMWIPMRLPPLYTFGPAKKVPSA